MKIRSILKLLFVCSLVFPAACDKKDPVYNTSHPDHATVTLTTEWSGIGKGLKAPESYTVTAALKGSVTAGYSATLTGVTNKFDHLFAPGTYRFLVHNTPEYITVSGTTATVEEEAVTPADGVVTTFSPGPADNPERLVRNAPGWLFTSVLDATLKADSEQALTAQMQQQVRQLTLIIEPIGSNADKIKSIGGVLSGVAGSLDIADGTHGSPSFTALTFTKIPSGTDAGKWSATVRLLGVAGTKQWLMATIAFADSTPALIPLDSDLTADLATFNAGKHQPLTLGGQMEIPTEADFGAIIPDWISITDRPVVAE